MDNSELLALYSRLGKKLTSVQQQIERTRLSAVLFVGAMILALFGLGSFSSHLIVILGSLVVFILQLYETSLFQQQTRAQQSLDYLDSRYILPRISSGSAVTLSNDDDLVRVLSSSRFTIGFVDAFAARVVSSYALIFLVVDISWVLKIYMSPGLSDESMRAIPATSFADILQRLTTGVIPGWAFIAFAILFWIIYLSLSIWHWIRKKRIL